MRCSFSEANLDAYVEGTLGARARARVDAHLANCASCAVLLEEFRVIDALLITPRTLEPAPNFTFRVMADVRAVAPPRRHRSPALAVLGTYMLFAWVTIGAFGIFAHAAAVAALVAIGAWLVRLGAAFATVAGAVGHVFGRQAFGVTTAMSAMLALDVVAAAAVFGLYAVLRARRAAVESERC
jgi:anti-sigma factor RsiW